MRDDVCNEYDSVQSTRHMNQLDDADSISNVSDNDNDSVSSDSSDASDYETDDEAYSDPVRAVLVAVTSQPPFPSHGPPSLVTPLPSLVPSL